MRVELSCGAICFTIKDGIIYYCIIKSLANNYGFPKGHVIKGESERETAIREVKEETNLDIRLIDGFKMSEEYVLSYTYGTAKKVVYFLGEIVDVSKLKGQKEEILEISLEPYKRAQDYLSFENSKNILFEANKLIKELYKDKVVR